MDGEVLTIQIWAQSQKVGAGEGTLYLNLGTKATGWWLGKFALFKFRHKANGSMGGKVRSI